MRGEQYVIPGDETWRMDSFLSYWMHPHNAFYKGEKRNIDEGVTLMAITHPSTKVVVFDITSLLMEDHPHLRPIFEKAEWVHMNRILLDPEAPAQAPINEAKADGSDMHEAELISKVMELFCQREVMPVEYKGRTYTVWAEYMHSSFLKKRLTQAEIAGTEDLILDAYDQTCRKHDLSEFLAGSGANAISSLSVKHDGTPVIQHIMGEKVIDEQVEKFRESMNSWLGGGET